MMDKVSSAPIDTLCVGSYNYFYSLIKRDFRKLEGIMPLGNLDIPLASVYATEKYEWDDPAATWKESTELDLNRQIVLVFDEHGIEQENSIK